MLPCQANCPDHAPGCHKSCPHWAAYQEKQNVQRQKKKDYLNYYNELCATMTRAVFHAVWSAADRYEHGGAAEKLPGHRPYHAEKDASF